LQKIEAISKIAVLLDLGVQIPLPALKMLEKIKNKTILVEGKKDKSTLEALGCKKVITLKGRPLFKVIEDLKCKEICILTDLDNEGKRLYHKLQTLCTKNGIKVDNSFRNYLFKETKIRQIEGLKKLSFN